MADRPPRPQVLVLDDDEAVRRTLGRWLDAYGYRAVEAATFDEAIARLETTPGISAVILDVRLPGGRTGLDVLVDLRRRPGLAHLPVLILTGGTVDDDEAARIARHRAHLFYKPEGFETLLDFLDRLTGRDRPA